MNHKDSASTAAGPRTRRLRSRFAILLACALGLPFVIAAGMPILAQRRTAMSRVSVGAEASRSVAQIMAAQSASVTASARPLIFEGVHDPDRHGLPQNPKAMNAASWPNAVASRPAGPVRPSAPQTLGIQFDGATGPTETGAFPPDTMGTVGPNQFVLFLNGRIRSFNKTTGAADGVLNADPDVFFASVMTSPGGGEITFTSDPNVRYDRLSKRWFLTIIDVTLTSSTGAIARPNRVLIAVSDAASNGTLTGATVFRFLEFQGDATNFADYPSLGIDANALYIGADMFGVASGTFVNTNAYVIPKAPLLNGNPITVWTYANLIVSNSGPFAPRGVDNPDPANTGTSAIGYFIGVDNATFGTLMLRRITNPGSTSAAPTISGNISISSLATTFPVLVPHLGNTLGNAGRLDSLDDRLFEAAIRNGRLWTAHNIGVNNVGSSSGTVNRNAARWYEIQSLNATPSVVQAGTLYDNSATNDVNQRNYWIPSITVSGQGHAALGCSVAGTNERVNAFTTGRLVGDALGTLEDGPGGASLPGYTASATAYNPPGDPGNPSRRWGDYSFTSVDPNDDMTMWTIQEYCNGTNTYGARALKLIAPPPATPSSASGSAPAGASSTVVTITGTTVPSPGSGFFDPGADTGGPGFANHITASVTGGVTVNSITFVSTTSVTLDVNTVSASPGTKNVTVCNPDGQCRTGTGILTVSAALPPTPTPTPTLTHSRTPTVTLTSTLTPIPTRTPTRTATFTVTPTFTMTFTPTRTPTNTPTLAGPTATFTPTPTVTSTPTITPTFTPNPGQQFFSVAPCRIIDTRLADGPLGGPALAAGTNRDFVVTGVCGVPLSAQAVSINATITQPTSMGFLTVYPAGTTRPLASTINYNVGQTRANNALLMPAPTGSVTVFCGQGAGTVHFILDVNGYFQ